MRQADLKLRSAFPIDIICIGVDTEELLFQKPTFIRMHPNCLGKTTGNVRSNC